ncbi:fibrillin-2-like isoform X4 [Branchiostoma floridae]|uniref:Fibrillin-2-like isoform X4 n=1 Tax=Branchiostoma floridae TaxID=7739 RepID=A0A9J7LUB4_BRAFL|nr:fibrillin-2-like isoform X4 [Branchiostoma floridae]
MGILRASLIGFVLGLSFAAAGIHIANAQTYGSCHGGFPIRFLGHCFRVNKRPTQLKAWLSARADCESIFAASHLLTDMTQEIHDELATRFSDIDSFWLGLNDRGIEGEFYWGNPENTPLGTPTQWDPSSPNDAAKDCVAMTRASGYMWVPTDCSTRMAFICSQDVDECQDTPCNAHATCTNTDGSFTCTCKEGYTGDGFTCTERCGQTCGDNAECRNTGGSTYECTCNDGFEGDGINCTDHDECNDADGHVHCHEEHGTCVNYIGGFDCICKAGYARTNGGLDQCVDVDECQSDKFVIPCPGHSHCENTMGSFICECDEGHRFENLVCEEIDECAEGSHNCPSGSTCSNTDGSFNCTCGTQGYVVDGDSCVDEDECQQSPSPCHVNAACTNTDGSYTCACRDGFQGDGNTCTDINECAGSPCDALATCTNTVGSFQCVCGDGYQGDGMSCEDEDECLATPSPCPANTTCTNIEGSYSCQCKTGFTGTPGNCIDTDECAASPSPCQAPSTCINAPGTYTCACTAGYEYVDSTCKDVDECAAGTHNCHQNADCGNQVGTFSCTCRTGYVGDGRTCADEDECQRTPSPCSADRTCTNTDGSFTCTCRSGYRTDGNACTDIDECSGNPTPCHQQATCQNTQGSYTCSCNSPYEGNGTHCTNDPNSNCVTNANGETTCTCRAGYSGDGYTCSDVNECAGSQQPCDTNADCTNTVGSYTCTCRAPYRGDGKTECVDASNSNCVVNSAGVEVCSCKAGFVGAGFRCTDVNECAETPRRCHLQASCANTPGSFQCTCNQGYQGDGIICNSDASVACTGDNLSKQRYQVVLDNVTLTQGLQDATSAEYRAKKTEIELLLEPSIRTTQHGSKVQSVVVKELKIVENEVVAVYDVCLENVNAVHGLDIQNELRAANSVDNTLGVNLQTVCFLESNSDNCPTSQSLKQTGESGLNNATALALGIALGALFLLLLIAIACWARNHKKSYGENKSVGSVHSAYASTYHHPQFLHTSEHLYPTPSGPTVWPTVASESIPSTFPAGSTYY